MRLTRTIRAGASAALVSAIALGCGGGGPGDEGHPCKADVAGSYCNDGLVCNIVPGSLTCVRPMSLQPGEVCGSDDVCAGGLVCTYELDPAQGGPIVGTCQPLPAACSASLPITGNYIPQVAATGTPPTPGGGTIVDGTYDLTKDDLYPPSPPSTFSIKETIRLTGDVLEEAGIAETSTTTTYYRYTFTTSGTQWTLTNVCPPAAPLAPTGYTATDTTLLMFNNGEVLTFTKR